MTPASCTKNKGMVVDVKMLNARLNLQFGKRYTGFVRVLKTLEF